MPSEKRNWVIEITKGFETSFRKHLPGNLSAREITTILQRLASRDLSPREVIAASVRKPRRTSLLDVRVDGPPRGKRVVIWLPVCTDYKASYWRADEILEHPEILPDE